MAAGCTARGTVAMEDGLQVTPQLAKQHGVKGSGQGLRMADIPGPNGLIHPVWTYIWDFVL